MHLVLCNTYDLPALWVYKGLRSRCIEPVELVPAEALAYSLRWEHRLGHTGSRVDFRLANGKEYRSDEISGVFNRLVSLPNEHLQLADQVDMEYANQEFLAFFTSWLHGLRCPVLNRPSPQGLSGRWRHPSEWVWLAARAGLPIGVFRQSSRDPRHAQGSYLPGADPRSHLRTIFIVEEEVVGVPVPEPIREGCRRLALGSDTPLLGIDFAVSPSGEWRYVDATQHPDLRVGGPPLLDALSRVLSNRKGVPSW